MWRTFLRAKIHKARITQCDLNYEGSISICPQLLRASDIRPFEKVEVYNISNGVRLETYVIEGQKGQVGLNGAAARLAQVGDLVIICSYVSMATDSTQQWTIPVIICGEDNQILEKKEYKGVFPG